MPKYNVLFAAVFFLYTKHCILHYNDQWHKNSHRVGVFSPPISKICFSQIWIISPRIGLQIKNKTPPTVATAQIRISRLRLTINQSSLTTATQKPFPPLKVWSHMPRSTMMLLHLKIWEHGKTNEDWKLKTWTTDGIFIECCILILWAQWWLQNTFQSSEYDKNNHPRTWILHRLSMRSHQVNPMKVYLRYHKKYILIKVHQVAE